MTKFSPCRFVCDNAVYNEDCPAELAHAQITAFNVSMGGGHPHSDPKPEQFR